MFVPLFDSDQISLFVCDNDVDILYSHTLSSQLWANEMDGSCKFCKFYKFYKSFLQVKGLESTLVVFSHDVWDEVINKAVRWSDVFQVRKTISST